MHSFIKLTRLAGMVLFFAISSSTISAQEKNYVADLPTPDQLITSVKGNSPADTYAKQAAVMENIYEMIQYCIVSRRKEIPAESEYLRAMNKFTEELYNNFCAVSNFPPAERNSRVYFNQAKAVYAGKDFEKYVVDDLFGPLAKQQYADNKNRVSDIQKNNEEADAARKKASDELDAESAKASRNKLLLNIGIALGVLIVLLVFGIRLRQMFSGGSSGSGRIT